MEKPLFELLPDYRLKYPDDPIRSFEAPKPLLVELGFGDGRILAEFAKRYPYWNCLGVEVYRPGIAQLIKKCVEDELRNVRIAMDEALTVLEQLPDRSIDKLWLFFPDPWPKTRHHKRRLVTPEFLEVVSQKLKENRIFNLATDWDDYAQVILETFAENVLFWGGQSKRLRTMPISKYERRGRRLKHNMYYFEYTRLNLDNVLRHSRRDEIQRKLKPAGPVALLPPPPDPP